LANLKKPDGINKAKRRRNFNKRAYQAYCDYLYGKHTFRSSVTYAYKCGPEAPYHSNPETEDILRPSGRQNIEKENDTFSSSHFSSIEQGDKDTRSTETTGNKNPRPWAQLIYGTKVGLLRVHGGTPHARTNNMVGNFTGLSGLTEEKPRCGLEQEKGTSISTTSLGFQPARTRTVPSGIWSSYTRTEKESQIQLLTLRAWTWKGAWVSSSCEA
jgi:hypothetical protein